MNIYQNSILKLVFRQGTNNERKQVLLTSGEPAYSTDLKRLFVGDGVLSGGNVSGNLFLGETNDLTLLSPAIIGDLAKNSDTNSLYRLKTNDGSTLSDWEKIAGVYSSNSPYITVSVDNKLTLNALSANSLASDIVSGPIILSSGRLSLSSTIPFQTVSTKTITVSSGLKSYVDGADSTNTAVNVLSSNIVIQSNNILASYNGTTNTINYSRNLSATGVSKLSSGHYIFYFGPLTTSNIYPIIQLSGETPINCSPRVLSVSNNQCIVRILSSDGINSVDATLFLTISY